MSNNIQLLVAKSTNDIFINSCMANRHGLIAGATGTGKTVSLQVLAESFSANGVPVFMTDIKGDLSGIAKSAMMTPKLQERLNKLGITSHSLTAFPACFWDLFGEQGHPIKTTISEMGPLLLGRLLNLNDTQSGVLNIVFKIADDAGLLLLDLKDLRAMLNFVGENRNEYTNEYGNVTTASIGSIQRGLLTLEQQGGDKFFGEPAMNILDFIRCNSNGKGIINILAADKLMLSPSLYSTFLLWMLSELYEQLPEVGDLDKPKLVFFFDEAHLLFNEAPKALLDKIEQVIRLIRSKGVGVYFITQNPMDVPESVLRQLGNRIQHALRAFTPKDQKAVKTAAETFRPNPNVDVEKVITELAVGEALVSFLDINGTPAMVDRAFIYPPKAQIGPITPFERKTIIQQSSFFGTYEKSVDRESAFEMLQKRIEEQNQQKEDIKKQQDKSSSENNYKKTSSTPKTKSSGEKLAGDIAKIAGSSIGRSLGKNLVRGLMGSLFGR